MPMRTSGDGATEQNARHAGGIAVTAAPAIGDHRRPSAAIGGGRHADVVAARPTRRRVAAQRAAPLRERCFDGCVSRCASSSGGSRCVCSGVCAGGTTGARGVRRPWRRAGVGAAVSRAAGAAGAAPARAADDSPALTNTASSRRGSRLKCRIAGKASDHTITEACSALAMICSVVHFAFSKFYFCRQARGVTSKRRTSFCLNRTERSPSLMPLFS